MPEKNDESSSLAQEGQDLLDGYSFIKTTRGQLSARDQDIDNSIIPQKQKGIQKSLSKQFSRQSSSSSEQLDHQISQKNLSKQLSSQQTSQIVSQQEEFPFGSSCQDSKIEEKMLNEQEHPFVGFKPNGNMVSQQVFLPTTIDLANLRNPLPENSSQPKQQIIISSQNKPLSSTSDKPLRVSQFSRNIISTPIRLSTEGFEQASQYQENDQLPNENNISICHSHIFNGRNNPDDDGIKLKNQIMIFAYLLQFVKSMLVRFMYRDQSMLSALQYKIIGDSSIVIAKSEKFKIQQMQSIRYRNIFERIKYLREINFLFSKANTLKHRFFFLNQLKNVFVRFNDILKKRLTKFPLIKPNSGIMLSWDITFLMLSFLLLAAIPIRLAFDITEQQELMVGYLTYLQLFVFTFDIFLGFHSGFYEFGEIVMTRKRIQHEYFHKKLLLTFFSTGLVIASIVLDMQFLNFFSIILRISSLGEKIEKIDQNLQLSQQFTSTFELIKLLLITMISIHLFGCGFHFVGDSTLKSFSNPTQNWIADVELVHSPFVERYMASIYFAMISMTTIGYGDIHPVNVYERMYVLGMSFISCGLFAFNLNFIGGLISDSQKKAKEFRNRQYSMWCYMNDKQVKKTTQLRVLKYLEFAKDFEDSNIEEASFLWFKGAKILNSCSQEIREELLKEQFGRIIKSNRIFKTVFSKEFIAQLSLHMRERRFASGEVLITKGQRLRQLYFVTKGKTEYFYDNPSNDYSRSLCDLNEGVIDFKLFVTQQPSTISIKSKGITTAAFIDLAEWQTIIQQFSHDKEKESYLRDQFIYDKRYQFPCKSCGQFRHDIYDCPQVNYKVNKPIFFTKLARYSSQENRVFLTRKIRENLRKGTLSKCQETMKALKLIRWKHAKNTHDMYEDIDVDEEVKFIERDKDFFLRCPRIKQSLLRKQNCSFQDDAYTKIKLTENSDNPNNCTTNQNKKNNQQFQSSAYEEDNDNYFISEQSSSSDSVSESLMSDSDNSKQEYEIISPKTNKTPSNTNPNNNNNNNGNEQISQIGENLLSATQIPSIGNNIIINGESHYASFVPQKQQTTNITQNSSNPSIGIFNNSSSNNNISNSNSIAAMLQDRRQSTKVLLRGQRNEKIIEELQDLTSISSSGYEETPHHTEKGANSNRKSSPKLRSQYALQIQNSSEIKDKSGEDFSHSFARQLSNIQQSLNNDASCQPALLVVDCIADIIATYKDKLAHLSNQSQPNSSAIHLGNSLATQPQLVPTTPQFMPQNISISNQILSAYTQNSNQGISQLSRQASSPYKQKKRLMSKLSERSSMIQSQIQQIQQQLTSQPTKEIQLKENLLEIEQKISNIQQNTYYSSEANLNKIPNHLFGKCEFFFDLPKEFQFYYTKFNNSNVVKAYKKYQQLFKLMNNAKELGIFEKSTAGRITHQQTSFKRRYLKKATLAMNRSKQTLYGGY